MQDYFIKQGDTFYRIAQSLGISCQELLNMNPAHSPHSLQVGQKIVLPEIKGNSGQFFAEISPLDGQEFSGQSFDDVEVDIEGIKFRVKRVGEHKVPHEVHLILPRTEIYKREHGPNGSLELQLMLSNINIVNSPRLMSEGMDKAETGKKAEKSTISDNNATQINSPEIESVQRTEEIEETQAKLPIFNPRMLFKRRRK